MKKIEEPREWNIQEHLGRTWVDITPRTELMTRFEMIEKLSEIDKVSRYELRGHNVVNNAKHGQDKELERD